MAVQTSPLESLVWRRVALLSADICPISESSLWFSSPRFPTLLLVDLCPCRREPSHAHFFLLGCLPLFRRSVPLLSHNVAGKNPFFFISSPLLPFFCFVLEDLALQEGFHSDSFCLS